MKEQILQRITAVLGALNSITVSGKANLANLSGSIAVIEEIGNILDGATIEMPKKDESHEE